MNTINDINNYIAELQFKIKTKEIQDNPFRLEYYKGRLETFIKYNAFLSLNIDLSAKDCLEYLERMYYKSQQLQIKHVGMENTTGQPNLLGCFYLGKMNAMNQLKKDLSS